MVFAPVTSGVRKPSMLGSLKLFGWLYSLSIFIALYQLRVAPLPVLLMVAPTFALFQLLWAHDIFSKLPQARWAFKIPGVLRLRIALQSALALPKWVRILIVFACIFGGLDLAHFTVLAFANKSFQRTRKKPRVAELQRVRRAWRVTS